MFLARVLHWCICIHYWGASVFASGLIFSAFASGWITCPSSLSASAFTSGWSTWPSSWSASVFASGWSTCLIGWSVCKTSRVAAVHFRARPLSVILFTRFKVCHAAYFLFLCTFIENELTVIQSKGQMW